MWCLIKSPLHWLLDVSYWKSSKIQTFLYRNENETGWDGSKEAAVLDKITIFFSCDCEAYQYLTDASLFHDSESSSPFCLFLSESWWVDGKGRPFGSHGQVYFCYLWRLGLESNVSMGQRITYSYSDYSSPLPAFLPHWNICASLNLGLCLMHAACWIVSSDFAALLLCVPACKYVRSTIMKDLGTYFLLIWIYKWHKSPVSSPSFRLIHFYCRLFLLLKIFSLTIQDVWYRREPFLLSTFHITRIWSLISIKFLFHNLNQTCSCPHGQVLGLED